jgi:hypothetical protein
MSKTIPKEKGRRNRITGQLGEYLATAELARHDYIVTTFAGNVPDFDVLAVDRKLRSIAIQVKTIRGGSWQFNARAYLDISYKNEIQKIIGKKRLPNLDLIYIFVVLGKSYGQDDFYLIQRKAVREIIYKKYSQWLIEKKGRRPKNPESFHCGIEPKELIGYRDRWDLVARAIQSK